MTIYMATTNEAILPVLTFNQRMMRYLYYKPYNVSTLQKLTLSSLVVENFFAKAKIITFCQVVHKIIVYLCTELANLFTAVHCHYISPNSTALKKDYFSIIL